MSALSLRGIIAGGAFAFAAVAVQAQDSSFNASRTFEFDPERLGCSVAEWRNGIGLPDADRNTSFGLRLAKSCATSANVAAGAVLNGIAGTVLASGPSLGFDVSDTTPCTGGSPRFNVRTSSSFHFVGGCGNGQAVSLGNGWKRVTFNPYDPTQAFPPLPPNSVIESITLIADEQGTYLIDNIQVNFLTTGAVTAGKPGAAK